MFGKRFSVVLGICLLAALVGGVVLAQGDGPGSDSDPLVSRSYVDKYVQWEVLQLEPGQRLIGEGGAEIILRSGKGAALANQAGDGVADVTQGKDLAQGENVPRNHQLIVPRTDGRGIVIQPGQDAYVMVRGGYRVE